MNAYDPETLTRALVALGLGPGDIIFSHSAIGNLGLPQGARSAEEACRLVYAAIREALGPQGTLLVPTYTLSFTRNEIFDPAEAPSPMGRFAEYIRRLPGSVRSIDPLFSIAGIGKSAKTLLATIPPTSFGADCVYERLLRDDAWIVNLGLDLDYLTILHHIEWRLRVPYRFDKIFRGVIRQGADDRELEWTYYVRHLSANSEPDLGRFLRDAREQGLIRYAAVGKGRLAAMRCRAIAERISRLVAADPWVMAKGPPRTYPDSNDRRS